MATGQIHTPWPGIISAVADTLYEMSGQLMTRVSKVGGHAAGDTPLEVESTDRFPAAGRLSMDGRIIFYTSKTDFSFVGITDEDGNVGLPAAVADRTAIADISRLNTQFDDLRASFIVTTAEEGELDILGRNYGLFRPRGLPDSLWRGILQALLFIEAQTIYSLEQVLDILWPGQYTLYEDLVSFPHTVFVIIPAGGTGGFRGKAWLVGGEVQNPTGSFTVDVDNPPRVIYGVYEDFDIPRTGINYALRSIVVESNAASPQTLTSTSGLWIASDDGKPVITDIQGASPLQHWKMTFVDADDVTLRWDTQNDGTTNGASPDRFVTDIEWFPSWVETFPTELVIVSGPNAGTFPIDSRISRKELESTGAGFVTDTDVEWYIQPVLPTAAGANAEILRAQFAGNTITVPTDDGALPADLLVDYTHVPSAQALLSDDVDGNAQYPFYLWDDGAITIALLDLITAAGVRVVLLTE